MLDDVARECVGRGGTAIPVPTDVSQRVEMENLARVGDSFTFAPPQPWPTAPRSVS